LSAVAGLVVLALVAATVYGVYAVRRPFPDYDGTQEVVGLQGDVEVVRDEHGIPHIYADSAADLFRAQGYVHAMDRFWEMDLRRHITGGRLAELFGSSEVETDTFLRTMGWRRVAEQELPLLDPASRRYLQAYSGGVNAWLGDHSGGDLGVAYTLLDLTGGDDTPEPWNPADSLSWLKAMAWDLRGNIEQETSRALLAADLPIEQVEELFPEYPYDMNPPIVADAYLPEGEPPPPVDDEGLQIPRDALGLVIGAASVIAGFEGPLGSGDGLGSNSWVVDGTRTQSGMPLLANDPHLGAAMPSIWYQVGLHCRTISAECPFDVTGFSFSGVPGVVIGHNSRIAWGFTNLNPDVTDLYLERVDGDMYQVGDQFEPMDVRTETINVAGDDPVRITVRETRHGPIISDASDDFTDVGARAPLPEELAEEGGGTEDFAVALRWTALDPGHTADALFALNAASDWETFRQAAALFEVPSQNLVYADVDGNIGYQSPGKIPVRRNGDGRWPVPGWTDDYEWVGYIAFEALPSVFNPAEGFIATANQPVTSPEYPFVLTEDFSYGWRGERIVEMIEQAGLLDAEAMTAIQMDTHNPMAEILAPYLLDLEPLGDYHGDGIELLREWDFSQGVDSAPAAYFNGVWRELLRLTFHDELPEEQWPSGGGRWFEVVRLMLDDPGHHSWDSLDTPDVVETRDDILAEAARAARDEITRLQGKDPEKWEWGRLHALTLEEPSFGGSGIGPVEWLFNTGPVDVGGGPSIVHANGWDAVEGFETTAVPSMRMVIDLADLDESTWIDLTGVSGHPFHEQFGDQTELWATGGTLPMRSDAESIEAEAEYRLMLVPTEQQ
jgi:penicillin amidase